MKRKIKEKSRDKKSTISGDYLNISEFNDFTAEVEQKLKTQDQKIKAQDRKIQQLIKSNKEFKNSTMALYSELETLKSRESASDKVCIELPKLLQKVAGQGADNETSKNVKQVLDNKIRLDNNDLVNLFKGFVENCVQNYVLDKVNKRNNYGYMDVKNDMSNARSQIVPFDEDKPNNNFMLENGPLSPRISTKNF